ncbi:hypothetical protein [Sphingomonas sp.]|uniref:hypothetical protein n=1 Tax=Sphingomonas sp. TaxID=28214 RepID=UPI003BAAC8B5
MRIENARGRLVGRVQEVNRNARGRIESLAVRVGDRVATLPASNFSADGDVLVSAMGKGEGEGHRQVPEVGGLNYRRERSPANWGAFKH